MSQRPSDREDRLRQRRQSLQTLTPLELAALVVDYDLRLEVDSDVIEVILEHEFGLGSAVSGVSSERDAGLGQSSIDLDSTVVGASHSDQSPAMNVAIPVRLGDFRILREVGKGGMGIVYEAVQESLGRRVALKVLPHHSMLSGTNVQRFQQESRAAASLHHTNIVPVFGVGDEDGLHYYVMQFIDGFSLRDVLCELGQLCSAKETSNGATSLEHVADRTSSGPATDQSHLQRIAQSLLSGRFAEDTRGSAASDAVYADSSVASAWSDELAEMPTVVVSRPIQHSGTDTGTDSQATEPFDGRAANHDKGEANRIEQQPDHSSKSRLNRRYWLSVAQIGVQVADAMDYAHGYGVLHRDIKPGNLLVDTKSTVWVTDFGLAKAKGYEDLTLTGDILGTIRYMAPERFNGEGDVRSDVYSLGLTLYELLTHRPAFRDPDRHRLMLQVLNEEPPRPRKLRHDIPRDLETIVLKAAAREPRHRYQTPREMADDLRRFLQHKPIAARQTNAVERMRRWCRRNPVVAGLSAALLVAVIAGFSAVVWQWRDAEHHRQRLVTAEARARGDRDFAVEALNDAEQQRAAAIAANTETQRAIEAAILAETEARKSEAEVKQKLELLQMNLADFERERELAEKRQAQFPTRADYQAVLASNFHNLAALQYATGKTKQAIESYQQAIEARAMLVVDHPQVADYRDVLATSYQSLAQVHHETGDLDKAIYYYNEAISVRENLLERNSRTTAYQGALANSLFVLGEVQREQGNAAEASRQLRKALQLRQELAAANPTDAECGWQLAMTLTKLGQLNQELDRPEDAVGFYRQAVERWQTVVTIDPASSEHRLAYAEGCRLLGDVLLVTKGATPALPWYSKSVEILGEASENPAHDAHAAEIITKAHEAQATALTELGSYEEAAVALDRALQSVAETDRNRIRLGRALALARAGKHQDATTEAIRVGTNGISPELIYLSAKVFAVASLTVRDDKSVDNDMQGGLERQYADQAVEFLRACTAADFLQKAEMIQRLEQDADFLHLHKRADVQTLIKNLRDSSESPIEN